MRDEEPEKRSDERERSESEMRNQDSQDGESEGEIADHRVRISTRRARRKEVILVNAAYVSDLRRHDFSPVLVVVIVEACVGSLVSLGD